MNRSLANRIAKLEPRPFAMVDAPNVVTVAYGETSEQALAQFRTEYAGRIPPRHGLIVLPARVATADQEADFALRFNVQQLQLLADAKSAPRKETAR